MPNSQHETRRNAESEALRTSRQRRPLRRHWNGVLTLVAIASALHSGVSSFAPMCPPVSRMSSQSSSGTRLQISPNVDDEISQGVQRARALLEKSKAKLAAQDGAASSEQQQTQLPFFASQTASSGSSSTINGTERREQVTKYLDKTTGLITTDGEKMAAMSEQEEWENRSLLDVFETERAEWDDGKSTASKRLAERDVAASIYNLRKLLQMDDYRKIFDKRNRFIGEDN